MNPSPELARVFDIAVAASASAIHFAPGEPPRFRVVGKLVAAPDAVSDPAASLLSLFPAPTQAALQNGAIAWAETSVTHGDFLFAVSLHRSGGDLAGVVQLLPAAPPTLAMVGGDSITELTALTSEERGLILVSGPVGSGKHTTAFALLQEINARDPRRIYVVNESPANWLRSETGYVSAILVGQDAPDYLAAIRILLRGADADTVFLADLPTVETAVAALELASTGCLVVASVAAPSAASALQTLTHGLPESLQSVLTEQLIAVTNQRLMRRAGGSGKIPAYEILCPAEGAAKETLPEVVARLIRAGAVTEAEGAKALRDYSA